MAIYLSIISITGQSSVVYDDHTLPHQCGRLVEVLAVNNLLLQVRAEQLKQPTNWGLVHLIRIVGIHKRIGLVWLKLRKPTIKDMRVNFKTWTSKPCWIGWHIQWDIKWYFSQSWTGCATGSSSRDVVSIPLIDVSSVLNKLCNDKI